MTKYFFAENSNRRIGSFVFEPYEMFGGSWRGIIALENEADINAMSAIASDPSSAVFEISFEDYQARAKKKVLPPNPSTPLFRPSQVSILQVGGRAAAVVDGAKLARPLETGPIESIDAVLQVDAVTPSVPPPAPLKKGRNK